MSRVPYRQVVSTPISKGLQRERGLAMTEAILAYAQLEQATVEQEWVDLDTVVQDLLTQEQSHLRALNVAVIAARPADLQLPMPRKHVATIRW